MGAALGCGLTYWHLTQKWFKKDTGTKIEIESHEISGLNEVTAAEILLATQRISAKFARIVSKVEVAPAAVTPATPPATPGTPVPPTQKVYKYTIEYW